MKAAHRVAPFYNHTTSFFYCHTLYRDDLMFLLTNFFLLFGCVLVIRVVSQVSDVRIVNIFVLLHCLNNMHTVKK